MTYIIAIFLFALVLTGQQESSNAESDHTATQESNVVKLRGVVRTPEGDPAAGALVYLQNAFKGAKHLGKTKTDKDGQFELACEMPDTRFTSLMIVHPSGAVADRKLGLQDIEADAVIDVKIPNTDPITVKFFNPDGSKLTTGTVYTHGFHRLGANVRTGIRDGVFDPIPVSDGQATIKFFQDSDSFNMEIETKGLGRQWVYCEPGNSKFEVQLKNPCQLEGKLIDEDGLRSFAGVRLQTSSYTNQKGGETRLHAGSVAFIDVNPDGTFSTDKLVEGKLIISGARSSQSPWYIADPITNGATNQPVLTTKEPVAVKLKMKKAVRVRGRVTGTDGSLVKQCQLSFGGLDVTVKEGKYECWMPPGTAWGSIGNVPTKWIRPSSSLGVMLSVPQDSTEYEAPDIQLEPAVDIKGVVVDESGNPVANARVSAQWMARIGSVSSAAYDSTESDRAGRFVLRQTTGREEVTIKAATDDGATELNTIIRPGDKREINLVVSQSQKLRVHGQISDQNDKPIAEAKIEVWQVYRGGSGVVIFDGQRNLSTDKNGRFEVPKPLSRQSQYHFMVSAEGFSSVKTSDLRPPQKGDWELEPIRLNAAIKVAGRVIDSAGQPVSGASVWSFSSDLHSRAQRTKSKTGRDGNFLLSGILPNSYFYFIEHPDYRFTGRLVPSDNAAQEIRLARVDEPAMDTPVRIVGPSTELRTVLLNDLTQSLLKQKDPPAPQGVIKYLLLSMSEFDRQMVIDSLDKVDDRFKVELLLSLGEVEPALELSRTLDARTAFFLLTTRLSNPRVQEGFGSTRPRPISQNKQEQILQEATALAVRTNVLDDKILRYATLAKLHRQLGDNAMSKKIVDQVKDLAMTNELQSYAAIEFAEAMAPYDLANARKMVDQIEKETQRNVLTYKFLSSVGGESFETTKELLSRTRAPADHAGALTAVVSGLCQLDLERTLELVEKAQDRYRGLYNAECYGIIALVIHRKQPYRAKQLLRKSFARVGQERIRNPQSVLLALLRYAQEIDPDSTGEYWWRAVAGYGGPVDSRSNAGPELSPQDRFARLVILLRLYNRFPGLQRKLMNPIFEYWDGKSDIDGLRFNYCRNIFPAMVLCDPERSVRIVKDFSVIASPRLLRGRYSPWLQVADILSSEKTQLSRWISMRVDSRELKPFELKSMSKK